MPPHATLFSCPTKKSKKEKCKCSVKVKLFSRVQTGPDDVIYLALPTPQYTILVREPGRNEGVGGLRFGVKTFLPGVGIDGGESLDASVFAV